jgi:4-amino-4-deoxy-L-arabinose transferase-like glycosyltransferase
MNAFQPNAEILVLYVFAVSHNDLLAELPQWLAGVAVLFAVYGIARRAGAERPAAAFAGLLTLTLTEFALESVTTQNDLVAAAFVAVCAYFALGRRPADTALAGIALGAALGTKLTVALALPALVLVALVAGGAQRVLRLAVASAVAFLAVGFYGYGLNLVETGKLLGDAPEATALQPHRTLGGTASTVARVGFDTIDLSGYRPDRSQVEPIERLGKWTFDRLHIPVNPPESTLTTFQFSVNTASEEDNSYFGPLGWLLLVPLCLVVLVLGALRRVRPVWTVLAASLPLYVLGVALAYRYNLWIGRFMLTAAALAMPLAALLYRWRLLAGVLAAIGAFTLYVAHAHNDTKPTGRDGTTPVWDLTRAQAIAVRQPVMLKTLTATDEVIPEKARILAVVGENDFVYAFYGPRLERRVFTVHTQDVGWPKWQRLVRMADDVRADWILVNGTIPIGSSQSWKTVTYFDDDGWTLVHRT